MARLIIVAGEPGVGKSFIANEIAEALDDNALIRSDEYRKTMFDSPEYSHEESTRVYARMFMSAQMYLSRDIDVIMDATFGRQEGRIKADELAEYAGADLTIVRVRCDDEDEIKRRLDSREGVSDADFDVYKNIKHGFRRIDHDSCVEIDNSGTKYETLMSMRDKLDL